VTVATPRRIRPRQVFCVIASEHEDLECAIALVDGTFTHFGVTVDVGHDPDWLSHDLPADEEWRIDWWKFGYGLDLAYAHRATRDERFKNTWSNLVDSFVRRVPVGGDSTEVAARRLQNWIYAWSAFDDVGPELERRLLERIEAETAYVRHDLTPARNHRTLELYGLFLAALAFPSLDRDGALLAFATDALHRNLLADFRADGVHCEASTHYHLMALRSLLGARENGRRFGVQFPMGFDDLLASACEFAMHSHRPDGVIAALSDSDSAGFQSLLGLAAELLDREDLRWVSSAGSSGTPPSERFVGFTAGGYHFQRSGWGEGERAFSDERFLVLDCGPLGDGGHGHYDLLSVEIAADGRPLVIDPGRHTYSEEPPNLRRWFKGTAAHNTVCVDGLDQTPYRRGKPKGPVAEGRLLHRHTSDRLDMLVAQAISPVYDSVHTRRVLFVNGEYWLIEDRLEGARPHRFDLRFHLTPAAQGQTVVDGAAVLAPGLALVFGEPHRPSLEGGWVAPTYGRKEPAPVVSVVVEDSRDATFFTLVAPGGQSVPSFEVRSSPSATIVEVVGAGASGRRDWISWSATTGDAELAGVAS
jgi:Heparinase II/III-like protein/Heparinase II/III N-terminus